VTRDEANPWSRTGWLVEEKIWYSQKGKVNFVRDRNTRHAWLLATHGKDRIDIGLDGPTTEWSNLISHLAISTKLRELEAEVASLRYHCYRLSSLPSMIIMKRLSRRFDGLWSL
jgi:hypothetical protein